MLHNVEQKEQHVLTSENDLGTHVGKIMICLVDAYFVQSSSLAREQECLQGIVFDRRHGRGRRLTSLPRSVIFASASLN